MDKNTFNYIVVGAGAAGCVVANRLSENPDIGVLLLEAGGPDRNPLIHMPAGFVKLIGGRNSLQPRPERRNAGWGEFLSGHPAECAA
jgi:choline dehydrogenase